MKPDFLYREIKTATELQPITNFFVFSLSKGEFCKVNDFLKKIEIEKLSKLLLMSICRTCFSYKNKLDYYNIYLGKCYVELEKRYGTKKANHILRGLIDER